MTCDKVIFKENALPLDDFIRLKEQAFGRPCHNNTALRSLMGSSYVLHAEIDGEIVGMARIVGDGGFVNYIADVIVMPEHQGKGLGRQIMERILEYIKQNISLGGRAGISLFAAKSKEGFYEKFGFKSRPDEIYGAGMQLWFTSELDEDKRDD